MAVSDIPMPEGEIQNDTIVLTQRHREHGGTGVEEVNAITGAVVAAGVRIHQKLGPGLLESVYEVVLARDLARLGCHVERQKAVSFEFEGTRFDDASWPDLTSSTTPSLSKSRPHVRATRCLNGSCSRT